LAKQIMYTPPLTFRPPWEWHNPAAGAIHSMDRTQMDPSGSPGHHHRTVWMVHLVPPWAVCNPWTGDSHPRLWGAEVGPVERPLAASSRGPALSLGASTATETMWPRASERALIRLHISILYKSRSGSFHFPIRRTEIALHHHKGSINSRGSVDRRCEGKC